MSQTSPAVRTVRSSSARLVAGLAAIGIGAVLAIAFVLDRPVVGAQAPTPKPPAYAITMTTVPNPPATGVNDFEVIVQDPNKKPVVGAEVSVSLMMPSMPGMGKRVVALKAAEGKAAAEGKYVGQGRVLMGGKWEATITAKVGGKDVAETKVPFVAK